MNPFNKAFSWPLQWNRNYLYGKWTNNMTWVHSSHHLVWHKEFFGFLRIPCNRMRWFIFTSYSVHEYSNFMQIGALSHITSFQSTPPLLSTHLSHFFGKPLQAHFSSCTTKLYALQVLRGCFVPSCDAYRWCCSLGSSRHAANDYKI